MIERYKIIKACLICGSIVGAIVVIVTSQSRLVWGWGLTWSVIPLLSLFVTLIVVTVMFGREWFGND